MGYHRTLGRSAAIAVLCASGAVVAFATIAPSPDGALPVATATRIEPVLIRAEKVRLPVPDSYIREERFERGDTLPGLLFRLGIASPQVERLMKLRALHGLRPGATVTAEIGADGQPRTLGFLAARDAFVQIVPQGEGYRASEEQARIDTQVLMKSGVVRSSLFAATDAAAIPDSVAIQLADVFGGDIDFYRDLRKGDRFSVVYELQSFAGRPLRAGRVLAAEFINQRKAYRAVRFGTGYYAPDGKNLRKAFLRSPLEFSRVSSGFGMRVHPFMKTWRAHKGIDYAAPAGTRVRAVGEAVVDYAGPHNGYGNVVILRHQGQYTTLYAHLSRIAVRRGMRVAQGDAIGAVGQTGWATGPHLHYEFRIAGEARNPLSIAMPAALPVAPKEMPAFRAQADPLAARLDLLADSHLALLE